MRITRGSCNRRIQWQMPGRTRCRAWCNSRAAIGSSKSACACNILARRLWQTERRLLTTSVVMVPSPRKSGDDSRPKHVSVLPQNTFPCESKVLELRLLTCLTADADTSLGGFESNTGEQVCFLKKGHVLFVQGLNVLTAQVLTRENPRNAGLPREGRPPAGRSKIESVNRFDQVVNRTPSPTLHSLCNQSGSSRLDSHYRFIRPVQLTSDLLLLTFH